MRTVRRDVEPVAEPGDPGPASISPVRPAPIRRPTSCSPSRRPSGCRLRPQPSGAGLRGRTSRRTSWSAGVPSVEGPGLPDEATYGDDRVGEVEEGVDHVFFAFVAALQPVEGVVPGIRAFDVPPVGGLDGALTTLRAISPVRSGRGWPAGCGWGRVVAGVQVQPGAVQSKGDDVATNRRDEQELSVAYLHVLQVAVASVNTLLCRTSWPNPRGPVRSRRRTGAGSHRCSGPRSLRTAR